LPKPRILEEEELLLEPSGQIGVRSSFASGSYHVLARDQAEAGVDARVTFSPAVRRHLLHAEVAMLTGILQLGRQVAVGEAY
jgi:hypothetical protein